MINVLFHEQPSKGFGGSKVSLLNLVNGLVDEVRPFVVGNFPAEILRSFPAGACHLPMPSGLWPAPPNPLFGRYSKTARWLYHFVSTGLRLAAAIRHNRIDIVHANNNVNSNAAAIFAARLTGRPCVCHLRGTQRTHWETKRLFGAVDHYVAIAGSVRDFYAQKGLLDGKPVSVIFNGVNVEQLAQRVTTVACRRTRGAPRVAMFGRPIEFKGHEYFIRAAAEVTRSHPEIEFVVNGPVPTADQTDFPYFQQLSATIKALDMAGRISFAGPYCDVAETMGQADVAVCCSPYRNFERILFEAMACGVPVVAFDSGGVREVAIPDENCLLVPNRDHVLLAREIIRAILDQPLREKLTANGRACAQRLFDFRANAQEVLRIYEGLIAEHGRMSGKGHRVG